MSMALSVVLSGDVVRIGHNVGTVTSNAGNTNWNTNAGANGQHLLLTAASAATADQAAGGWLRSFCLL